MVGPAPRCEPLARATCYRCFRPTRVCYCESLPAIESETRVLFLQHPREEFMPIGTARMASLCLPGSVVLVGTELERDPRLVAALDDPARPAVLLWPGGEARDLASDPPSQPVTLIVVDGTWSLAKKLVRLNPRVAALPRYSLTPPRASEYRIRPEPAETCVSTIEAVMFALGILERDPARFETMMRPFRAMVDAQIEHAERIRGARLRHPPGQRPPLLLPPLMRDRARLVLLAGEANAFPRSGAVRSAVAPDELVQVAAHRLATGESFDQLAAPRAPIAPGTPGHTRLDPAAILAAPPLAELVRGLETFLRPDDVVLSWGRYAFDLLRAAGLAAPAFLDVRAALTRFWQRKPGAIEAFAASIGCEPEPLGRGRGGLRLALLTGAVEHALAEDAARSARASRPT